MVTAKKIVAIPFLGGRLEVCNAYDYTDKEGNVRQARPGVTLHGVSRYPVDVTGIDLEKLGKQLKGHKLAQQILEENQQLDQA